MHIKINGVHIEVTGAIKSYVYDKINSLKKFVPSNDTSVQVEIFLNKTTEHHNHGDMFQAEGVIHVRGKKVSAKVVEDDLYKSIDALKDMLARELIEHKDKQQSLFRRSAQKIKRLLKRS